MATGLDTHQQAFANDPNDQQAFEALEEHFFLEGNWEALARVYRERIEAPSIADDTTQRCGLLFRLGQILEERILDSSAASEVYWELARLDPSNRPALRQLRGIHESREQWDMVLQIAEIEGQTDMPPYERAAFQTDLGNIWRVRLSDPEEARCCFERALEADPDFPAALEGLASLHEEDGQHAEAASVLERLAAGIRGPERAPVWITLGRLYAGPLGLPERATECFDRALEDDPFQTAAVEWALLLATAQENWEKVSELLESRFDLAAGARHRAAIAVEASQIQLNHLSAPARARAWADRAVELAGDELSVLLAHADVERADGDRDALLATLGKVARASQGPTPRAVLVETAELHASFGHRDEALAATREAIDRGDADVDLLTLQANLLREQGNLRELADALETLCAVDGRDTPSDRAARLRELARIQADDLADAESAEISWQRAFELEPTNAEARQALEIHYHKSGNWDALRGLLESALEGASDDDTARLSTQLGEVLIEGFDDPEQARTAFERALSIDPTLPSALAGLHQVAEATQDTELLLDVCEREATDLDDATRIAELARIVIPLLLERERDESALEWAGRWSDSGEANRDALITRADLEAKLDRCDAEIETLGRLARLEQGSGRAATLRRQARLLLDGEKVHEACKALEAADEAASGDLETLQALRDCYRTLNRPTDLVRVLRPLSESLPPDEQLDATEELARLLHDPIGDLDGAIVVRWRLAEMPGAPEEASLELEALLETAGRYAELVQLLETRRFRLGDESEEAFALDVRRGTLMLDALGHCEEAAELFTRLHDRHPEDDTILDALERALRAGQDTRGLADLLAKRAEWESDADRRIERLVERARLLEESLGEPMAACDLYEYIAAEASDDETAERALTRIESLLEGQAEWVRLRDFLLDRVEGSPDEDRVTLRERLAVLCRDRLGDVSGCAEQLEAIAVEAPEITHVWQQLAEIYAHDLDRPADWLRVVDAELANEPSTQRELGLRVSAARLCLNDDRRPQGHPRSEAFTHFERVIALAPGHSEATEALIGHYTETGRHEDVARILEGALEHLPQNATEERCSLRLRLAGVALDELDDIDRAGAHLEAARQELGADPRIADPLAQIFESQQNFEKLAELSRQALGRATSPLDEVRWRVRLGRSESALGNLDSAALAFRAALVASPDDREIEDALIEIYREVGEAEPLVELIEKRLPYAQADEALASRLELARVHIDLQDKPRAALRQLEWVVEHHPHHRDAFDQALALAEELDDAEQTLAIVDRGLERNLSGTERSALLEKRGHLVAGELGHPDHALACFREALALDPTRSSARLALRALLEQLGRWPAVLDCLFIEAAECDGEDRIERLEKAADIAWNQLRPDAALPWLSRLRAERPEDPELLARLAEVHRRAGRFEAALRAIEDELTLRSDRTERHALHIQRAQLLERDLNAPSRAASAYVEARETSEDPSEVLIELDRLYAEMHRPLERAAILEDRIGITPEAERLPLRREVASIYSVDLARPDLAIPHLLANVADTRESPADEMVHLGALDAALRAAGHQEAWTRAAERELELLAEHATLAESTPAEYVRFLHEELARVYDEELGHPDRALAHLDQINTVGESLSERVRISLRSLLARTGRSMDLAHRLDNDLNEGFAGPREWLELARLREEVLLDLEGAHAAYCEARVEPEIAPDAIRGMRRCAERLRNWNGLAEALELELEQADALPARDRAATARKLGDVYWQRLGSGDRAATALERALELDPKQRDTLTSLIGIKLACGLASETVELFERELEMLEDQPEHAARKREIWLQLASVHHASEEAPRDALAAYLAAAKIEPLSAPDALIVARLHESLGETDSFAEAFGAWCDREDSASRVSDHLELARLLAERGDLRGARKRTERATQIAPEDVEAWRELARLELESGNVNEAALAFESGAGVSDSAEAAALLVSAAATVEPLDPERAMAWLQSAIEDDPACLDAHVALTRVAATQEGFEEACVAAETALELAEADPQALAAATRLELALAGGRAAVHTGLGDAARRLFGSALEVEPDDIIALEGLAECHFADGDFRAARTLLERRVELPGEDPNRARNLTRIARGLEAEDHLDGAWSRYEEALVVEPGFEAAHEGLVRVHERAGRCQEALSALEAWVEAEDDDALIATTAVRAAELAMALEDRDRAERSLTIATTADPSFVPAWLMAIELAELRELEDRTRQLVEDALERIEPSELSAPISLRAARFKEIAGDKSAARERYAEAARWDPRCVDAALSESRLARSEGDFVEADGILARFLEAHPDPMSPSLAHLYLERGRLLSGPLEGFEESIDAYERALELQPDLGVARTALARLLLHVPDRVEDALALHRSILEASPTSSNGLRALLEIAEVREDAEVSEAVLVILRALGQASPEEASEATTRLRLPLHAGPPMSDPAHERLRRLAHLLHEELADLLSEEPGPALDDLDPEIAEAARQILAVEAEVTLPNLGALEPSDRQALFSTIGAVLLEPGGNGGDDRFAEAVDRGLGRWTRRKARRLAEESTLEEIESLDYAEWSTELRSLAAAQVIDRHGGDLRTVLRALLALSGDAVEQAAYESAELGTLVCASDSARGTLKRVVTILCDRLSSESMTSRSPTGMS